MEVEKHGTHFGRGEQQSSERFACMNCGCKFKCEENEYYVDFEGAIVWKSSPIIINDYLICSCPECHKIVKKIREHSKQNISVTPTGEMEFSNICISKQNTIADDNTQS